MISSSFRPGWHATKLCRLARHRVWQIVLLAALLPTAMRAGDAVQQEDTSSPENVAPQGLPEPVTAEHFEALKTHSPFLRSVGLSDSIVLTGIACIHNKVFATLFDTESRESHLVSRTANPEGWQLVDVSGDETDLESLTAKIQIGGGEVLSIRYEKLPEKATRRSPGGGGSDSRSGRLNSDQMKEAKKAAVNYKEGFSSDGYPRQPPSEVVKKLSKLNTDQRESINRDMIELRNKGLGMDERRRIYNAKVDQSLSGRR